MCIIPSDQQIFRVTFDNDEECRDNHTSPGQPERKKATPPRKPERLLRLLIVGGQVLSRRVLLALLAIRADALVHLGNLLILNDAGHVRRAVMGTPFGQRLHVLLDQVDAALLAHLVTLLEALLDHLAQAVGSCVAGARSPEHLHDQEGWRESDQIGNDTF